MKKFSFTVASFFLALSGSTSMAQTSQTIEGNNNFQQYLDVGEIYFVIGSEVANATSPSQQKILENLADTLASLEEGVLITEYALRILARNSVSSLAEQPLTKNIISERQFTIPYQMTHNIEGTRNRITYNRDSCGGGSGITFTFNREQICRRAGGTYTFSHEGEEYDLVFDGYADDSHQMAQFSIHPTDD